MRLLKQFGWVPLALLSIVFSLKILIEPDIWWQLAAGKRMLETGHWIYQDPFSFTTTGATWINIKWGFEILIAWLSGFSSPASLPLLQALVTMALTYVLYRTAIVFMDRENEGAEKAAMMTGILFFLVAAEYRFNSRPEMFSHLFTAIFIWVLSRKEWKEDPKVLWLLPVQWVWSNTHDGYVVGLVLGFMYALVSWMRYAYGIHQKKPVWITWMFFGLIAATLCNPYGYHLIMRAPAIFSQVKETKYTTEFLDYTSYLYWTRHSYMVVCLFLLVFLVYLFRMFRTMTLQLDKWVVMEVLRYQYFMPLMLMGSFTLLALMAYRNIVFLAIVCTPHLIHVLEFVYNSIMRRVIKYILLFVWLVSAVLYVLVVSDRYYTLSQSRNHFGLAVLSNDHPVEAGQYLLQHKPQQPIFSDYLNSSYLIWNCYPNFKSFIDLRDFEVFTSGQFDTFARIIHEPQAFVQADSQYQFGAVVLLNNQGRELHQYLYAHSGFHLQHLDAVCAVYERGPSLHDPEFKPQGPQQMTTLNQMVVGILNPWYRLNPISSGEEWALAATYFRLVGDEAKAMKYTLLTGSEPDNAGRFHELMGGHYFLQAQLDTSSKYEQWMDSAEVNYRAALYTDPQNTAANDGMAKVSYARGQFKQAIHFWEKVVGTDRNNLTAHLYMADCFERLATSSNNREYYQYQLFHLKEANRLNPNNPFIETDLGFTYARLRLCDDAVIYLTKVRNFKELSDLDRVQIMQFLKECGAE